MAIRVALNHRTAYAYDRLVTLSPQVVRLRPAPHCRTPICSYSLHIEPQPHFINWQQDPQGNYLARLVFPEQTRHFSVEVDLTAELTVINPFDFFLEPQAEHFPFAYEPALARELKPFLQTEATGPRLSQLLERTDRSRKQSVDFLVELNQRLQQQIAYVIRLEPGVQSCEETLEKQSGSCRDSAWLLVQILRHLGLAARFVSGYLIQLKADVAALDGPSGTDKDFTDLHAWAEAYLPGAGWIGLDPTSGLFAGEGHIPLACTPEPSSAAPISGAVDECEAQFDFAMEVSRIHEDPRVTLPYTESQWRAIDALGCQVDRALDHDGVRLTMGGEPTFVSIDDMDSAEWNTDALGPTKRERAAALLHRLRHEFAPGGLLHFGQGKWYPGEPLPRWALSCYWRTDAQPIWLDPALIADEGRDYGVDATVARRFAELLADRLEVGQRFVLPAYEDVFHYAVAESRLPVDLDPLAIDLDQPAERRRLARLLTRGLGQPTGMVLPLERQWWQGCARWGSGPWMLGAEQLFLIPGDSPMGLRLPIESLPVGSGGTGGYYPQDPMGELPPLPPRPPRRVPARQQELRPDLGSATAGIGGDGFLEQRPRAQEQRPPRTDDAGGSGVVRTALCVEPRDGKLHIFMPPVGQLEDYLALIAAIEDTAMDLQTPVLVEGYHPPADSRLQVIKVTPDPGVIEVNIHPSHNWNELVCKTSTLYEQARLCRLGTEKFDLDGRHTGTGGGNHVVLGGATPSDSPFVRRPDLLQSLLAYWNNHPSLSYLFSGTFIGPTSQAPRVDESRGDALYELELAFSLVPEQGSCPPWLVDRLFRHLLVDVTGNTHRAEFCIDKLFSPDSVSGRLGLVELRALEMPPHAQMSLTQQLLLRALVARFWRQPYRDRLVHWGTSLHDRFMLPHFVRQDFTDVLDEIRRAGFDLRDEWFDAHFEFRFPKIGTFGQRGVEIELRQALEPWYVLGEEPAAGSTTRFVDSSVERLQLTVCGMTDTRHVVTCNGRRVPLRATGTAGEMVAGVRYRAWQPPHCLHPTIPIHTPLVLDLIDTWAERSIGGCTYHVAHPGGRNYTTFPVNANEAEARRTARFFSHGHTAGIVTVPPSEHSPDYPLTLDLRRAPGH